MPPLSPTRDTPIDTAPTNGNGNGHAPARVFAPPESFALRAISWHRWLVIACAVVCCAAGIAYGAVVRKPVYTSTATLQVGEVNPNSPGFLGYTQSAASLATAFARSIDAQPVLAQVEGELGLPAGKAIPRLSSAPIPLSPAFQVIATGPSAEGSMALANTTANAVVAYEAKTNSANPQAKALLSEFQKAALAVHRSKHEVSTLQKESASERTVLEAEANRSAAKVKLQAIENAYVAAVTSQAPRQGLVTVLATATSASNDRKSKIEMYGLLGLVVGLAIGCAAALFRERRATARLGPA